MAQRRSVSSTMERIQNTTIATLDRMTALQQRYRQHQETMKAEGDRSRRASISSATELVRTKNAKIFRSGLKIRPKFRIEI